jgi:PAS domain S-box-containing protein
MPADPGYRLQLSSEAIFERAPVGYMVLEESGIILAVNQAWCRSLGYPSSVVIGKGIDSFVVQFGFSFSALLERHREEGYIESAELKLRHASGHALDVLLNADLSSVPVQCIYLDVTEKKRLEEIRTLRGFLPICAGCKRIRNEQGSWVPIEVYIKSHTGVEFSHGICPECSRRLYPEIEIEK